MNQDLSYMHKQLSLDILSLFLAAVSVIALSATGVVSQSTSMTRIIVDSVNGTALPISILSVMVIALHRKIFSVLRRYGKVSTHVLALFFSLCTLIGVSFSRMGNSAFILQNPKQLFISIFFLFGYFYIYDATICFLFNWLEHSFAEMKHGIDKSRHPSNHSFVFFFIVLILAWSPFLIVFFPGSVPHDGYYEINQAFGISPLSNHHPYLMSLLIGVLVSLGNHMSNNAGIFTCVLFFTIAEALCYSIVCRIIQRWSSRAGIATLIFFSVLPVWGGYAQAVIKDGLFSATWALFFALSIQLYVENKDGSFENTFRRSPLFYTLTLLILGLVVSFSRNNGIYFCIPQLIVLISLVGKKTLHLRLYLCSSAIIMLVIFKLVTGPLMSVLGVVPGSVREALSVPFQQTARFMKLRSDEVSKEEFEIINQVLPASQLGRRYDPDKADPVKGMFKVKSTKKDLIEYFKVWFAMGLRHPRIYIDATLANTYGYFYPFKAHEVLSSYSFYIKGAPVATGEFDFHYEFPQVGRDIMTTYTGIWKVYPVLSLFVNPASYTWILLFFTGFMLYTRRGCSVWLFLGAALNVGLCVLSPINGLLRYALPLMAVTPTIAAFSVCRCFRNSTLLTRV
ncbi:DUF6020 family protein [uncultured Olegusella sp.]|uniref:DUF6020 family protein n=1 Tax=uncultured Olegusella sp. TaxID=1979846 RepID=UPI002608CBFC|nr:DUF6020 family protein [uncultured Olegusella sp.]